LRRGSLFPVLCKSDKRRKDTTTKIISYDVFDILSNFFENIIQHDIIKNIIMTDKKELEELIKNQLHDMDSTQYEDLDENIANHSNEGLKSPKSRSYSSVKFKK